MTSRKQSTKPPLFPVYLAHKFVCDLHGEWLAKPDLPVRVRCRILSVCPMCEMSGNYKSSRCICDGEAEQETKVANEHVTGATAEAAPTIPNGDAK